MSRSEWFWPLSVIGMLFLFGVMAKHPPRKSEEWASWIQAIGSIAAIGGAAYIGERQRKAAVDAVIDAHSLVEEGRKKSILAIAQTAKRRAEYFEAAIDKSDPRSELMLIFSPLLITGLAKSFDNVLVHEIGSSLAIEAFLDMSAQYVLLGNEIKKYVDGPLSDLDYVGARRAITGDVVGDMSSEIKRELLSTSKTWQDVRFKNIRTYVDAIKRNYEKLSSQI